MTVNVHRISRLTKVVENEHAISGHLLVAVSSLPPSNPGRCNTGGQMRCHPDH